MQNTLLGADGSREVTVLLTIATVVALPVLYWVLGIVGVTPIPTTVVFLLLISLVSIWAGYRRGGVIPNVIATVVLIWWIFLFPPILAVLLGTESVPWYTVPSPLPVLRTPMHQLETAATFGFKISLAIGFILGNIGYLIGVVIQRIASYGDQL